MDALEETLQQYVAEPEIRRKLTSYFTRHELIGEELFPYITEGNKGLSSRDYQVAYRPVAKDVFIRRIPFYFYTPDMGRKVGSLHDYTRKIFLDHYDQEGLYEQMLETLYGTLERMHYHHHIDLKTLFEYPIDQTGQVSRIDVLYKWARYLDLTEQLNLPDKTPRHLLVDYNYARERAGQSPEIFELEEQNIGEYIRRSGNTLEFQGTIPCDPNGQPILRWIGAQIRNPVKVWAKVDKRMHGSLYVEISPTSAIWGLNCWGKGDDGSDMWYPLYIGPQRMEFDPQALKGLRQREKLTQKEVSDAIGASVRTYQKWESGNTSPDSHYLLRLMNVLDVRDTMELTKVIEPD